MFDKEVTVEGGYNSTIVGRVTDVSNVGTIWEVETKQGDIYERCPYTGKFYKRY